jgi:hypothetical protein
VRSAWQVAGGHVDDGVAGKKKGSAKKRRKAAFSSDEESVSFTRARGHCLLLSASLDGCVRCWRGGCGHTMRIY